MTSNALQNNWGAASPRITFYSRPTHTTSFLTAHTHKWKEGRVSIAFLPPAYEINPTCKVAHFRAQLHTLSHGKCTKPFHTESKKTPNATRADKRIESSSVKPERYDRTMVDLIPPLLFLHIKPLKRFLARNAVTKLFHTGTNKIQWCLGRTKGSSPRQEKKQLRVQETKPERSST